MIITDKFVLINFPKTGTSFVRSVLKKVDPLSFADNVLTKIKLKKPPIKELLFPNMDLENKLSDNTKNQHGVYRQIPMKDRDKIIVSIIRHPYERLISQYTYAWWKKKLPKDEDLIKSMYPSYPDFTIRDFIDYQYNYRINKQLKHIKLSRTIGLQSLQLFQFYSKDPMEALSKYGEQYINNNLFKEDMPKIHFLHTENLNAELYDFLKSIGYAEEKIGFIKKEKKVNISNTKNVHWSTYIKDDLLKELEHKEKLFFKMFPEYRS